MEKQKLEKNYIFLLDYDIFLIIEQGFYNIQIYLHSNHRINNIQKKEIINSDLEINFLFNMKEQNLNIILEYISSLCKKYKYRTFDNKIFNINSVIILKNELNEEYNLINDNTLVNELILKNYFQIEDVFSQNNIPIIKDLNSGDLISIEAKYSTPNYIKLNQILINGKKVDTLSSTYLFQKCRVKQISEIEYNQLIAKIIKEESY